MAWWLAACFYPPGRPSRNASKRDQAAYAHELVIAQEARRQDRLERTYHELGIYLARHEDWARSVRPFRGQVSAGTRHRVLATMRAALNAAVKQRLITWNPFRSDERKVFVEGVQSEEPEV